MEEAVLKPAARLLFRKRYPGVASALGTNMFLRAPCGGSGAWLGLLKEMTLTLC